MNKLALITGATSGIGLAYSRLLGKNGWNLIITGRREAIIREQGKRIAEDYNVSVRVAIVDFNNGESYEQFLKEYVSNNNIGFLVNNVGFSNHSNFFNSKFNMNHKMIETHISRLTEITHMVVPFMKEKGDGCIINVSSLAGFLPSLSDPFYSGTKSFINTYSESISLILKRDNIIVQSLCPGFTKTDFHKKMKLKDSVFKNKGLKRWMSPEDVASYSYRKLKLGRVIVIPGFTNRVIYQFIRFIPKKIYYSIALKKRVLNEK